MKIKLFALYSILLINCTNSQEIYHRAFYLMGSDFDITVVASSVAEAESYIHAAKEEIIRIERIISSWDANSETSKINNNAGIQPVPVSEELFQLIERCIKISKLTNGAFDISYASMDKIWKFDGSMQEMPTADAIKKSVAKVGFQQIILNGEKQSVFLQQKGMKIGFGGIGKGYAADKAKALLQKKGVSGGIINASGDLNTWGTKPNGNNWMVAIVNPLNKEKVFTWLPIKNSAIVTSGNYEKNITFNGKSYSHIIDPRTGYPSQGIRSVSILTQNAELADALATSVFVMGVEVGLDFINQLKQVECILIDSSNKLHTSKNLQLKTTE